MALTLKCLKTRRNEWETLTTGSKKYEADSLGYLTKNLVRGNLKGVPRSLGMGADRSCSPHKLGILSSSCSNEKKQWPKKTQDKTLYLTKTYDNNMWLTQL
jgi:hypothetical protein